MRSLFRLLALVAITAVMVMPPAAGAQGMGRQSVTPAVAAPASTLAALGVNLIVNGDAETGASATDNVGVQRPNGWVVSGSLTQVQYGSRGGFPSSSTPGPADRGAALFAGGPSNLNATGTQAIDLTGDAASVDGGGLGFTLAGYLGGFAAQGDNATLTVSFQDDYGKDLATASIGPVTSADRGFATGLLARSGSGVVPVGARKAQVVLLFTRTEGAYNDGYADNLSLVLGGAAPAPASVRQVVGPGGGAILVGGGAGADGGVTVDVPHGVFAGPTVVTVAVINQAPAGVSVSGGALLAKTVEVTTSTGASLLGAVELQVNLTADDLRGRVISAIKGGVVVGSTVDPRPTRVVNPGDGVLAVMLDHFTKFTLFSIVKPGAGGGAPSNGTVLDQFNVTLTWTNPPGTTQYELQNVPFNGDGPAVDIIRNVETSFSLPAPPEWYGMLPDMTYFWRVRTTTVTGTPTEADWTAWGSWNYRTPKVASDSISPVSPPAGATAPALTPALSWANSNPAVFYYEVQVSKDRSFNTAPATATAMVYGALVHGGATAPANTYNIPAAFPLERGINYHWRVRPRIQGDGTPLAWPSTWSFQSP